MKTQFDLTKEGILVDLTVGARGLSARSRKLSEEAAEKHQADRRSVSGTVQKFLNRDLKGVTKALNHARDVFKTNTLPWDTGSWRLCPIANYDALRSGLAAVEIELRDAVQDLDSQYDQLAADYRHRVNDLADEIPFPSRDELASNFRLGLAELPIADPGSIYFNHMSISQIGEFQNNFREEIAEKLVAANEDLVYRIIEQVGRLRIQVSKDPKETKFHKSLITNIEKTVDVVESLNLTGDKKIGKLIARVRKELSTIDINDLKNDKQTRKGVENTTSEILKDLMAYGK
jgi:hypothetical protein